MLILRLIIYYADVAANDRCLQSVDVDKLDIYVYQLNNSREETEQLDSDEEVIAASHWLLPSAQFDGLWESLIYDDDVKNNVITSFFLFHFCFCHTGTLSLASNISGIRR